MFIFYSAAVTISLVLVGQYRLLAIAPVAPSSVFSISFWGINLTSVAQIIYLPGVELAALAVLTFEVHCVTIGGVYESIYTPAGTPLVAPYVCPRAVGSWRLSLCILNPR